MEMPVYERLTVDAGRGIRALPIVHGSVEFTCAVRELFLRDPPSSLVVELPENLKESVISALQNPEEIPVISFHDSNFFREYHYIMEPLEPLTEAIRSAHELGIPVHFADLFSEEMFTISFDRVPDPFSLHYMTPVEYYNHYEKSLHEKGSDDEPVDLFDGLRELMMAKALRNIAAVSSGQRILFVCGIKHLFGVKRYLGLDDVSLEEELKSAEHYKPVLPELEESIDEMEEPLEALLRSSERSSGAGVQHTISYLSRTTTEALSQPGYFNMAWLFSRTQLERVLVFNRITLHRIVYRETVDRYERGSGELVSPAKEKLFFRFARNWSLIENQLLPDMYRLVLSAKAFFNDNFARIMFDILSYLPEVMNSQRGEKKVTLDDLYRNSKVVRFRTRLKKKRRVVPPPIRKNFKKEKYPGEWLDAVKSGGICSYPPEDIIIENFGKFLQAKANQLLRGSQERTLPFVSSMYDGIDYRETIRNVHEQKIFVKELFTKGVDAGSVVIIFDEDEKPYEWKVVWWGEHNQESDMAFYSSFPGERIVGPGIFQCRYGGLMLTHPPGRLHDIWTDDYFSDFTKPADRLLAAAIEYNNRNGVVYLSHSPPSAKLQTIANRLGQKIIYIPIRTIDPVTLGRVRRFHVLDSHERRGEAGDYIW